MILQIQDMQFSVSFKYRVFNAWRWPVRPKHVECVGASNKTCCGLQQYVWQLLKRYTTTRWILQKQRNKKVLLNVRYNLQLL